MNCVFTEDNKKSDGAEHATTEEIKRRQRAPADGRRLVVFPEGTTTNGRYIGSCRSLYRSLRDLTWRTCTAQFRTGSFQSGAPVQPVVLEFSWRRFSPTWESIPVHVHLWRALTQFTHSVTVTYLPVYYPSVAERANPLLYAANVRKAMAEALRVPCAEVGRGEKSEYHARIVKGCASDRASTRLISLRTASSTGGTGATLPRRGYSWGCRHTRRRHKYYGIYSSTHRLTNCSKLSVRVPVPPAGSRAQN